MTPRLLLLLLLTSACTAPLGPDNPPPPGNEPGAPDAGVEPVPVQQSYGALGLWTYPNPLSEVPDGAFSKADNVVVRRPGIAETRRGFTPALGTFLPPEERILSMGEFAGTLLAHTNVGRVYRYDGSAWTPYEGTYRTSGKLNGRRMRFLQMAESVYFTSDTGVKRIDEIGGPVYDAGVPQAVGAAVTLSGTSGFLPPGAATAYRFVWGIRNSHDRVVLGAPSGRVPVVNVGATGVNASVKVNVPEWVTTDHFLQVYRSDASGAANVPAGDDMSLVYEVYPTTRDIELGALDFEDVTPDELKATALYSSPNAGFPGSEKYQPPVCTDLAEYKGRMWCSATTQRQRLIITLLSADGASGGLRLNEGIVITNDTTSERYVASTIENPSGFPVKEFKLETGGTPSQNVEATIQSLIRVVNAGSSFMRAYYVSGEYDNPGQVLLEARQLGASEITVKAYNGPGGYWVPALSYTWESPPSGMTRLSGVVTVSGPFRHGFTVGQQIELISYQSSGDVSRFPSGVKTVTEVVSPTAFRYSEPGSDITSVGSIRFRVIYPDVTTDDSDAPNGLAYSEFEEPDAFPLANYLSVGSANYEIMRIYSLGDTLFIFKGDGTFILTGDGPETFSVREYPTPARLVAPDSVVRLGSAIYALTDQGVMAFTESGASVVSKPIEGDLLPLYSAGSVQQTTADAGFAVAYETEREYHLFLPQSESDTYATQVYVYNYATRAWTRWTLQASHGHVLTRDDREYLGAASFGGALVERKTRSTADYQDAPGVAIPASVNWQVRTGGDPSAYKQWIKAMVSIEQPSVSAVVLLVDTELSQSPTQGELSLNGLPYVMTYIPVEQSRSQTLTVGVSAGEVGRLLALRGLAVEFIPSSTKLR